MSDRLIIGSACGIRIYSGGSQAFVFQGDITKAVDINNLIAETRAQFRDSVHVLAHVTGDFVARKTFGEMDIAHWNAALSPLHLKLDETAVSRVQLLMHHSKAP